METAKAPLMNVNKCGMSIRCLSSYLLFTLCLCLWMLNKNSEISLNWDAILRWGLSFTQLLFSSSKLLFLSSCAQVRNVVNFATFCTVFPSDVLTHLSVMGLRNMLLGWKDEYLPTCQSVLLVLYVFVLYLYQFNNAMHFWFIFLAVFLAYVLM